MIYDDRSQDCSPAATTAANNPVDKLTTAELDTYVLCASLVLFVLFAVVRSLAKFSIQRKCKILC